MVTSFARFQVVALLSLWPALAGAEDFALQDGDTVAFLGDSITAARTYTKIIENYTLLRFPERKVRFVNAAARVGEGHHDIVLFSIGPYREYATILHGCSGIEDQVDCHLANLVTVDQKLWQAISKFPVDFHVVHIGVVGSKADDLVE